MLVEINRSVADHIQMRLSYSYSLFWPRSDPAITFGRWSWVIERFISSRGYFESSDHFGVRCSLRGLSHVGVSVDDIADGGMPLILSESWTNFFHTSYAFQQFSHSILDLLLPLLLFLSLLGSNTCPFSILLLLGVLQVPDISFLATTFLPDLLTSFLPGM